MGHSLLHQSEDDLVSTISSVDSSVDKLGIVKCKISQKTTAYHASDDASLFSTSLPVLPHAKLSDSEHFGHSVDEALPTVNKLDCDDGVKNSDLGSNEIGVMLPDDEEALLAGIIDEFDFRGLPDQVEDLDDYDLFGSGGGLEMDFDPQEYVSVSMSKLGISDGISVNGVSQFGISNGVGTIAGEHPYGEHPSRTLFVRNINSNVEDSELRTLFEQYGDIRALYTACKHRGFVMISYYDIRAARTAMRALQNKPLRRRKLDIHFSIPKDNPSEKDINQGTLVVFNLDASVTNDDLLCIFGAYGEVKEIRETPHKRHHKFIEFYDVRAAEAALRALNRSDIAGKRIKLEPSRPGGARRNLIQQLGHDLDQDELRNLHHPIGSPIASSPPGNWPRFDSPIDHSPLQTYNPSRGSTVSPINGNNLPGLGSILPHYIPTSGMISPIGKEQGNDCNFLHGHSKISASPKSVSSYSESNSSIGTLSGPQFLWGSPSHSDSQPRTIPPNGSTHGIPFPGHRTSLLTPHHYYVGSAPINHHSSYFPESPETPFMNHSAFGGMGLLQNNTSYLMNTRVPPFARHGPSVLGNHLYQNASFIESLSNTRRQVDDKKQYHLDLEKILSGEDTRTTLMIKNIPNKYTSKMLLATIDENHGGTYDFLYLPIDFKNKCNVGYAFINVVSPTYIVPFYEAFNGKKWEKFNSEKVASLAYARIQGKAALVTHFQNSSLMNEDKRCRPIVFPSEGQEVNDEEPRTKLSFGRDLNEF